MRNYIYFFILFFLTSCSDSIYNLTTVRNEHTHEYKPASITQHTNSTDSQIDTTVATIPPVIFLSETSPVNIAKAVIHQIKKNGEKQIQSITSKKLSFAPIPYANVLKVNKENNTSRRRTLSFRMGPILLTIGALFVGAGITALLYLKKDQQLGILFGIVALWFVLYKNRII